MKITDDIQTNIDGIAEKFDITSVLVMKSNENTMEVLASGGKKGKTIYHVGDKGNKSSHPEGKHPLYCEYVVDNNTPMIVDDASKDPNWSANEDLELFGLGAYIGFPVKENGKVVGTVCALHNSPMDTDKANANGLYASLEQVKKELEG